MSPLSGGPNPGHLKLDLIAKGARVDETVRHHPNIVGAPRLRTDVAPGLELRLPGGLWVNVSLDEATSADSPYLLAGSGDQLTLQRNGTCVNVRLVPQPQFYSRTTRAGRPMSEVGVVHGSAVAINPASACGFSLQGGPCRFCRSGSGTTTEAEPPVPVEEVVEVVRAAFSEGAVDFVYFNPPYSGSEDAGIAALAPYIKAVKRNFDTLVAVQMHPPKSNRWIERTYAMGVDALSYNVEIYDREILARRCPGRARYIGRERYYEALAHAAGVFPSGTVWSDLILGVEATTSTRQGIDALVRSGVLPVLSVPRLIRQGGLLDDPVPDVEAVAPLFAHLFHAVRQAKINMGWVRDLSFGITPLEARFFAGDDARAPVVWGKFYRSRLGRLALRRLSRLRRRLRVSTVSDSLDASHL